ncbi:succinyl-diaminopimelate desuccinylase [Blochmannia endosymbiont of Polyrhachis (Hedomyrma) turneri]|uniref:succinyl-diaminopimelate desuccinylase n=1 Tax=Blochmannia endosymbiont of Polyrhachis (Hedomyrma) turneri TaxID=1505596 RepID=UPI00061A7607|nr:succinyl-diaminopimelate desuccinylase [Blochmannia endosymbiont of Polyrhachis (Hedomyrma) turneri]AKC60077.1 succinyl-diaminopimelate desuccinylase [Blochmannia endosymbiont of Polyrhachis (Hedomyrma) turneri]
MQKIIQLAQKLINIPSLSPNDAGCQKLIIKKLKKLKFNIELMPFKNTTNLWASRGTGTTLTFAGHTDIVPPGNIDDWTFPPFEGTINNNVLYGRGATDMKGSLAAMIIAAESFITQHPNHQGKLSFLITSDEEGEAIYGTKKIIETLINRHEKIDYCLLGEPSSCNQLGDTIKNGRRGSLTAKITIHGIQGHVAYPNLAKNPIHIAITQGLNTLINTIWDHGNNIFPATTMQISSIRSGIHSNIIPSQIDIECNFRFNNISTPHKIQDKVNNIMKKHNLTYNINWYLMATPYFSHPGKLMHATIKSIEHFQKIKPKLDTSGGTSDGRFIKKIGAEIIELGTINQTMHKINECVNTIDLKTLSKIYKNIIERVLLS